MTEEKDWFDDYAENYVEPAVKDIIKKPIPDGWFGVNEILNWELHGICKEDLDNWSFFRTLSDIYSSDYWITKGFEDEGCFFTKEGTENLYEVKGNEDLFMYDFGDRKVLFNVYEIKNVYKKKNTITLQGWDYNILIDLEDKTIETIYTR